MSVDMMVLLGKCAEIELKSMELYDLYADCFEHDVDVARMWRKVAREEENHANQFRLAVKMKDGAIDAVIVDPLKVENALKVVQSCIDGVKQACPTLEDALRLAIELEEHLSCLHVDCVVNFRDEQYKRFFHAMMTCDNAHASCLQEAYAQQIKTRGL
jgi:rubrerythrin